MTTFDIIAADPPWHWQARSAKGEGRSAKRHYNVMGLDAIKRLPVGDIAARDSILFLWVIDPMLEQAREVLLAWGYKYVTVGFYWVKLNKDGSPFMGNGYYTRANPEQCWLCKRGRGLKRVDASVRRLIESQRGRHSEKPAEAYRRIERLFGPGLSRAELFAREPRPGWQVWGNEVDSSFSL